ncbi:DUF4259 domain-containing protein [Georgenia faecalis]|uniref:DUF4259 domain-containing protein n=1 Tax=Georgenia faecalis TaxID=2483799 RepID=UPI0019D16584|nr:DUF4259 domain-containing protein [Georgenia faecalis]
MIRDALGAVAHAEGYVEAEDAEIALAAAALVAAAQPNGPADTYGLNLTALEGLVLDDSLRALPVLAARRVLGAESEWRELWEEAGELSEARAALEPVLSGLRDSADGGS